MRFRAQGRCSKAFHLAAEDNATFQDNTAAALFASNRDGRDAGDANHRGVIAFLLLCFNPLPPDFSAHAASRHFSLADVVTPLIRLARVHLPQYVSFPRILDPIFFHIMMR